MFNLSDQIRLTFEMIPYRPLDIIEALPKIHQKQKQTKWKRM